LATGTSSEGWGALSFVAPVVAILGFLFLFFLSSLTVYLEILALILAAVGIYRHEKGRWAALLICIIVMVLVVIV
jgi:hypothetical protein